MNYSIVGVIGHIDHGKTSLVAALTGIDTDTSPEEKRRGITIDLGFATFTHEQSRFALIDAPGHQKYIGNLLAGVSSIDLALLAIASDQGVQTQTLEHTAIAQALGVKTLIVALTRCDLSSETRRHELREEVEFYLSDLGFHQSVIIETSTATGAGIDSLRAELCRHASTDRQVPDANFRMPIDRVFTKEGRGCIVAGTPWSGSVSVGDELAICGTDQRVRIRDLEIHGESVTTASAGLRTAMNVVASEQLALSRGNELVSETGYALSNRFTAVMESFFVNETLDCPINCQLHTATTQCEARIHGPKTIPPKTNTPVIITTSKPVLAIYNQPFLLRRPYPTGSFAGGRFRASLAGIESRTSQILETICSLGAPDPAVRLLANVDLAGQLELTPTYARNQAGLSANEYREALNELTESKSIIRRGHLIISRASVQLAASRITKTLSHYLTKGRAWTSLDSLIKSVSKGIHASTTKQAIEDLLELHEIVELNGLVALANSDNTLTRKQRLTMNRLLEMLIDNRTPPKVAELALDSQQSIKEVESLLRFPTQQEKILQLGDGLYYCQRALRKIQSELSGLFRDGETRTVAEIRDHLQITRKYAIPLLEYFDRNAITVRNGDRRSPGRSLLMHMDSDQ